MSKRSKAAMTAATANLNAQLASMQAKAASIQPGTATTYSSNKSISNTGQMSTSTQSTGATGAVTNTTNIRTQGDPGYSIGQESEVIKNYRKAFGL